MSHTRERAEKESWREHARALGVDPDESDDYQYWSQLDAAERVLDSFDHHAPSVGQVARIQAMREGGKAYAKVILRYVAPSADRTVALRCVHEAMMNANKSIVLEPKP